jgi:hypothetical protein
VQPSGIQAVLPLLLQSESGQMKYVGGAGARLRESSCNERDSERASERGRSFHASSTWSSHDIPTLQHALVVVAAVKNMVFYPKSRGGETATQPITKYHPNSRQ